MFPHFARTALATVCALWLAPQALAQCTGFGAVPQANAPAAEVVSLVGQGETRASGAPAWQAAVLAQKLGGGADMRTLALSSAALLLADRTQIRMSANAELRLCDAQPQRSLLELIAGRLWARTKRSPANLQLQTPAALAVVRGTDWDVQVEEGGRTTFTVLSGQVEFSNAYGRVDLGPAEQGIAVPGQAPTKRLLVNPRERVQWVMANPVDARRWREFQGDALAPDLAAVRADLDAGALPQARERLLSLRTSGTQLGAVELVLADLAAFDGRLEEAEQALDRAWQRTGDSRFAARRAELLLALDRSADARTALDTALARSGAADRSDLLLVDGEWYRLNGQGDEAIARYRAAVDSAQGDAPRAAALGRLGRALQERGDLPGARDALAQAVALAPQSASLLGLQATAATEALRLQEAGQGFDAALALQADDYESLAGAGFLALRRGEPEAARQLLLKALVIEPRYARAQVWLAVADYTLGERAAALDSLARARLADPKDPLPWQIESILQNDNGAPLQAIAAAREALVRLPYLKSLNPLASDSQGSANLGKALGDFGLEHWARAYAQQSYYPLWAGSHFFMANRYESAFSRNSELYQGYLVDPLAFGASEMRAPVLLASGSEWLAGASAELAPAQVKSTFDLGHRGIATSPVPFAWRLGIEGVQFDPRSGSGAYRLTSPGVQLGLGARPTDRLSLLLLHSRQQTRYSFPGGLALGGGESFDSMARQPATRTEAGGAWRWSADEQTWFKFGQSSLGDSKRISNVQVGAQDELKHDSNRSLMLRHTLQRGDMRLSAGWERSSVQLHFSRAYSLITSAENTRLRFDMPWAAFETTRGPWTWHAQASWPRMDMQWRYTVTQNSNGALLRDPAEDFGNRARRLLPRLGVSYRFAPGRALHAAYIESMYSPASNTLAPVAVGGIPIDYQYQMPGSLARKAAVQLDWEFDARNFGFANLSQQTISNATYSDGSMLSFLSVLVGDRVGSLSPLIQTAETAVDAYNGTPNFDRGKLRQASVAFNRILTPRWSTLVGYTRTQSRNTGDFLAGNALPGFPGHTLVWANVWRHGGRDYSYASLVYRSARFADRFNRQPEAAGWSLALAHSLDSADRRWSLIGTVQTPLDGRTKPDLWLRVRYRMD